MHDAAPNRENDVQPTSSVLAPLASQVGSDSARPSPAEIALASNRGTTTPLFVCGWPRSGTTFLTSLLDGHSQLLVMPEETRFRRLCRLFPAEPEQFLDELFSNTNVKFMDATAQVDNSERIGIGYSDYSEFDFSAFRARATEHCRQGVRTAPQAIEAVMDAFAESTNQAGKKYWVEKTPANEFHIQHYRRWWPDVRLIYIIRDPREVFLSQSEKARKKSGIGISVLEFLHQWPASLCAWLDQTKGSRSALLVRYEDLCLRREETLRKVCSFLDISFESILLTPTKIGKPYLGGSSSGQAYDPNLGSLGSHWRQLAEPEQIRLIESLLGKVMHYYGYPLGDKPAGYASIFRTSLRLPNRWQILRSLRRLYLRRCS